MTKKGVKLGPLSQNGLTYRQLIACQHKLMYLEGDGNYSRAILFSHDNERLKPIIFSRTLTVVAEAVPQLIRIRKSYAINPYYAKGWTINQAGGHVTMVDGTELLVSRRRWREIKTKLEQYANQTKT